QRRADAPVPGRCGAPAVEAGRLGAGNLGAVPKPQLFAPFADWVEAHGEVDGSDAKLPDGRSQHLLIEKRARRESVDMILLDALRDQRWEPTEIQNLAVVGG